jgi:hypothetical protein
MEAMTRSEKKCVGRHGTQRGEEFDTPRGQKSDVRTSY